MANFFKKITFFLFEKYFTKLSFEKKNNYLNKIIEVSTNNLSPAEALKLLFLLDKFIYSKESIKSIEYGNGIHTKQRHIKYIDFFIKNINEGENILDIGCGNGYVDYEIASQVSKIKIIGIDVNKENIEIANKNHSHSNINYIYGDALKSLPDKSFDVIILSNFLEHISDRVNFLKLILKKFNPSRILLRVPSFERDWRVPLMEELNLDYRLDSTHYIEYKKEDYLNELKAAGLTTICNEYKWGEIWSVVVKS
jgi:2-polyprenyl-3-methyl-5-hydroxy-6-metoxy-1,4-benzoquinol methylase